MKRITALLTVGLIAGVPMARAQTGDLPPARQIVDRFVTAIGGADAVRKHKSRRAVGTFSVPAQGLSGALELLAAAPDRQLVRISLSGIGEIQQGFDGRVAWSIDPMTGPRVLEGAARAQAQMDADFYSELHDGTRYTKMETVARTDFEGVAAYKVRLIRPSGEEDFEYFAVDTGLLVGSELTRISPMGPVPATSVISDYKPFGTIRLATRVVQRLMGMEQVITIATVEHDGVEELAFALPPPIRTLAK